MTNISQRARRLRLSAAALIAGVALYVAPLAVRSAYATEPVEGKCSVTCSRGTCSAEGACTCTCSLFWDIATCTCSGDSGGGSTGSGENAT
ncbi:MAG: hypothetical protein KY467_05730 [Gemmatimonadetes bacterium]|nr:hypothetical protein [Gemmatimonadota bacterium]